MNKKEEIIEILQDNDLDNIKELKKHEDCFIVKFTYEYDDIELEGAKEFADDECTAERESEEWFQEFFLQYLNDIAIDNINDIVDEIADDFGFDYEMLSFELSEDNYSGMDFLVAFYNETLPISIDDLILEL